MHLLALLCLFTDQNNRFSYPIHQLILGKSLSFYIPEAWKRYPFLVEPPCVGRYREYLLGEVDGKGSGDDHWWRWWWWWWRWWWWWWLEQRILRWKMFPLYLSTILSTPWYWQYLTYTHSDSVIFPGQWRPWGYAMLMSPVAVCMCNALVMLQSLGVCSSCWIRSCWASSALLVMWSFLSACMGLIPVQCVGPSFLMSSSSLTRHLYLWCSVFVKLSVFKGLRLL